MTIVQSLFRTRTQYTCLRTVLQEPACWLWWPQIKTRTTDCFTPYTQLETASARASSRSTQKQVGVIGTQAFKHLCMEMVVRSMYGIAVYWFMIVYIGWWPLALFLKFIPLVLFLKYFIFKLFINFI